MDKENPDKTKPIREGDDDSSGQNPLWPGDGLKKPDDSDGDTKIPLVR